MTSSSAEPRLPALEESSEAPSDPKLSVAPVPARKPEPPPVQEVEAVRLAREAGERALPEHSRAALAPAQEEVRPERGGEAEQRFDDAAPTPGNAPPRYPLLARKRGYEGRVVLRVAVSGAGAVAGVEVLASSGFEALDRAALEAVKRWRFSPARRGGEAVASSVEVPVVFELTGEEQRGG